MAMTKEEQVVDFQERVNAAAPLINAILKKHSLNLGAQFDTTNWPSVLEPVAKYIDVKDYAAVEEVADEKEEEVEGIESPIQREDLKEGGE